MVNHMKRILLMILLLTDISYAQTDTTENVKINTLGEQAIGTDEVILIENAKIHTLGSQGTLTNGSILIQSGKITMIGIGLPKNRVSKVINAAGKVITPGLMNAHTSLGLVEISAIDSTVDHGVGEREYAASFSVAGAINPNSTLIAHNRINGLTRAMVIPSSDKTLFQGSGSFIKLSEGMQPVVMKDNAAYLSYGAKAAEIAGGSRASALLQIKEIFRDINNYSKDAKDFKPKSKAKIRDLEALLPVFNRQIPLVVSVHRASDILAMIALKEQYSLKMILSGAEEGWMVADAIAAAKIPVLLDPYMNLPDRFETITNRIDNASLLNKANVELIIINLDFTASHNAYVIRQSAGHAVAHGLPWDVALAAITSTPSKWFGTDDSYGTLEAGKDADLVIWDGDPLEITTSAEQVFIQGKLIPMVSRQTRLRDRYLNKSDYPAAYSN